MLSMCTQGPFIDRLVVSVDHGDFADSSPIGGIVSTTFLDTRCNEVSSTLYNIWKSETYGNERTSSKAKGFQTLRVPVATQSSAYWCRTWQASLDNAASALTRSQIQIYNRWKFLKSVINLGVLFLFHLNRRAPRCCWQPLRHRLIRTNHRNCQRT